MRTMLVMLNRRVSRPAIGRGDGDENALRQHPHAGVATR